VIEEQRERRKARRYQERAEQQLMWGELKTAHRNGRGLG